MGNIEIAKSMLLSQFTHLLPIIDPSQQQWDEIECLLNNFIKNSEKNWISNTLIKTPKKQGGLYLGEPYSLSSVGSVVFPIPNSNAK